MMRGAETLAHVAEIIKFHDSRAKNTWFSTQTFQRNPAALAVGRGNWFKGVYRKQQFVTELYCFYADLDVKPSGYADLQAAVDALANFCLTIKLPPPSLWVCSGNGLQPYWRFEDPLTVQQWMPIANALKNAMKQHGLHADDACTSDAARILRPPGVYNWKDPANPKPTYILPGSSKQIYPIQWLIDPLTPYMGPHLATVAGKLVGAVASGATGLNKNLIAGVDQSVPVDLHEVATECAVFAEQFATNGAAASEPLWSLVAMASAFDKAPWDTFEELSKGYPAYDDNAARQKLAEKMAAKSTGKTGWPSCNAFSAESTLCQTCPHLAVGKTPLHLRAAPKAAPGVLAGSPPSLPASNKWWQEIDGSIWAKFEDPKTKQPVSICVLHYAISDGALDEDTGDLLFTADIGGRPREVRLVSTKHRNHDIRGELFRQGLVTPEVDHTKVGDFIVAWMTHLQNTKAPKFRSAKLGWDDKGNFTHGDTTWVNGKPNKAVYRESSVADRFCVKGSAQPWKDLMQITLAENQPALEVAVCTAFAAPLVDLSGNSSVLVSLCSTNTAGGKTTSIRTGCAVWGHPVFGVNQLDDTDNAMFIKTAAIRSMPVYWDEIGQGKDRDVKTDRLVNMVFRLGQGRDKDRANANLTLREAGGFQTMMVASSNRSIAEKIIAATQETEAGAARVFELRMPNFNGRPVNLQIDRLLNQMKTNFGHAGATYAQYLSANHAAIRDRFGVLNGQINKVFGINPGERYWATSITSILLGAELAGKAGIVGFNVGAMLRYLRNEVETLRAFRRDEVQAPTTPDALAGLLGTLLRESEHCIRTETIPGVGRPGSTQIKGDAAAIQRQHIWAQYAEQPNMLRVIRRDFEAWIMRTRGQSARAVIDELKKYGAVEGRNAIGAGTYLAGKNPDRPRTLDIFLTPLTNHLP